MQTMTMTQPKAALGPKVVDSVEYGPRVRAWLESSPDRTTLPPAALAPEVSAAPAGAGLDHWSKVHLGAEFSREI